MAMENVALGRLWLPKHAAWKLPLLCARPIAACAWVLHSGERIVFFIRLWCYIVTEKLLAVKERTVQ